MLELPEGTRFQVLAPVVRGRKGTYETLLADLAARVAPAVVRISVIGHTEATPVDMPPEFRGTPFERFFQQRQGPQERQGPQGSGRRTMGQGSGFIVDGATTSDLDDAVRTLRDRGARVIGTASEANHEYLRGLGAEPVAYGDGLPERVRELAPDGVDVVVDLVGGVVEQTLAVLKDGGRHASVADDAVEAHGGTWMWVRPSAEDLTELEGGEVQIVEAQLDADSPVIGRELRDLALPEGSSIAVLIRDDRAQAPRADTRLRTGDKVLAVTSAEGEAELRSLLIGE